MLGKSSQLFLLLNKYHRQQEKLFHFNDANYQDTKFTRPTVASIVTKSIVTGQSTAQNERNALGSNFRGFELTPSVELQRNIFATLIDLFRVNVNIFFNELIRSAYKNSGASPSKINLVHTRNRGGGGHSASHLMKDDAQSSGALDAMRGRSSYHLMNNSPREFIDEGEDATGQMSNPDEKRKGHVHQVIHSITDSSKPNSTESNNSSHCNSNPNNNNNNNNNNNENNNSNNNINNSGNDNSSNNSNNSNNNSNSASNGNGNNNAINQINGNSVGIGNGDLPHGVSKPTGLEPPRPEKPNQIANNSIALVASTSSLLTGQKEDHFPVMSHWCLMS